MSDVVKFPEMPIDLDRVRLTSNQSAIVLILPTVRREQATIRWVRGDLDGPFENGKPRG